MPLLRVRKRKSDDDDGAVLDPPKRILLEDLKGNIKAYEYSSDLGPENVLTINRVWNNEYVGELVEIVTNSNNYSLPRSSADQQSYDYYCPVSDKRAEVPPATSNLPLLFVYEELNDDEYFTSGDSDDSNAENYYTHDYPDDY